MSYGNGAYTYELSKGWGKLPKGYEFNQVAGVAVDREDQVYVFNRSNNQVMIFDKLGNFIKSWDQKFNNPHAIHIGPDDNIYLVDRDAHLVLKYSPNGRLLLSLGTRDRPSDTGYTTDDRTVKRAAGPFNLPAGVAVNEMGDIFVADGYGNARVHKYNSSGALLMSWGSPGSENPVDFHLPHGITLDNEGRLLVCDRENHRIQAFDQDGEFLFMRRGFRQPTDAIVDANGTIYISELGHRITIMSDEGKILAQWGDQSSHEPGQFVAPHGIAIDSHGDLYIGEVLEGQRIQKFVKQQ